MSYASGNATAQLANNSTMVLSLNEMQFALRSMFYLVTPSETTHQYLSDVPSYMMKALTYMPVLLACECLMLMVKGRKQPTYADALCSLSCALFLFLPDALLGQMEIGLYIWCYDKVHVIDLPWDSVWTWVIGVISVDFCLYLWHRGSHEINFLWAIHQVHHTPQEFNLFIGLRLPALSKFFAIFFYLPASLILPPPIFYAHFQLNLIFQFWTHTAALPKFGIFDYIVNNPSLHRVHHGRNRYCIDKNYGAVFTIWDILFGTFERERDEEIHYGLVHSLQSLNPIYIQYHHYQDIVQNLFHYKRIDDKVCSLVKGPGWSPGKPRLGDLQEIPEVPSDVAPYRVQLPIWTKFYLLLHYAITFILFFKIKLIRLMFGNGMAVLHAGFVMWQVACTGLFLDNRRVAPLCEGLRCAFYFVLEFLLADVLASNLYFMYTMRSIFFVSFLICAANLNLFSEKKVKAQ